MVTSKSQPGRTVLLATFTLMALAANSVFCRLALGENAIDAASFSTLRLGSGAITLAIIMAFRADPQWLANHGSWPSALLLFLYAAPFSFAYISLSAGTGALILFGTVQVTMLLAGLFAGERPSVAQWAGLAFALGGLVYLVFPGLTAPAPLGSGLMIVAGIAWGFYSLRGRGEGSPVAVTAGNFVRAVPLAVILSVVFLKESHVTGLGAGLAIVSGGLTSGLGYVLWYTAIKGFTATRAAVVQLPVPVLSAIGGVIFLSESLSLRLVVASAMILGGVWLAILERSREPSAER
jgi:drug/metabolite transporter (DMT)-like permease